MMQTGLLNELIYLFSAKASSCTTKEPPPRPPNTPFPPTLCESPGHTELKIKRYLFILLNYCVAEMTLSMIQTLPVYHHSCSACFTHIVSLGLGHRCGSAGA